MEGCEIAEREILCFNRVGVVKDEPRDPRIFNREYVKVSNKRFEFATRETREGKLSSQR